MPAGPNVNYMEYNSFEDHSYRAPGTKAHVPAPKRPYQLDQKYDYLFDQQPEISREGTAPAVVHQQSYTREQPSMHQPSMRGMPASTGCAKCGGQLPLDGTYVTAEGQCFHHECFTCVSCNHAIQGLKYKLVNGQVQCVSCSSPPCDCCNRPIEGRQLAAEGRVYHPECFRCNKCDQPLRGEYAINPRNGDRTCMNCDAPSCVSCRKLIAEGESYHCARDNSVRCVPCARQVNGASHGAPRMHEQRPGGYWRPVPAAGYGPPRRAGSYGPPRRMPSGPGPMPPHGPPRRMPTGPMYAPPPRGYGAPAGYGPPPGYGY